MSGIYISNMKMPKGNRHLFSSFCSCKRADYHPGRGGRVMNSTTFQGNGNVAYIPIIIKDKLKRTNADRIRAMTDEELAEMLSRSGKYFCHWNGYDPHSERCDYGYDCEECWLDWLKQEAN